MSKDAQEYIRKSRSEAERDARAMKAALEREDQAAFGRCLRDYLLKRFDLDDDGSGEQNIEELARMSLRKSVGVKYTRETDKAINCTNASSAEEKALLFMLVVQRALGLSMPSTCFAEIETLPQLAEALWETHRANGLTSEKIGA